MNTDQLHKKFQSYFGADYKKKDLPRICKFILRNIGQTTKSPVEEIKKHWGKACNFLEQWQGGKYTQPAPVKKPKMNITAEQQQIFEGKICPYCKQPSQYVDSKIIWGKSYGMIYYCQPCQSWVGVHKDEPEKALGRLANAELRELKKEAHAAFDPIWKSNMKSRHDAYTWLSEQLGIPRDYTHIGYFGVETCKKVITICKLELQ